MNVTRTSFVLSILLAISCRVAAAQGQRWVSTGGLQESYVTDLRFVRPGELVAQVQGGGSYRSFDTGKTWEFWIDQSGGLLYFVDVDPTSGTYYAVRGTANNPSQLVKSTDGVTWADIPNPDTLIRFSFLRINPVTGILYMTGGNEAGEYRTEWTSDGGRTWKTFDSVVLAGLSSTVNPVSGNTLSIAAYGRIRRCSSDNADRSDVTPDTAW